MVPWNPARAKVQIKLSIQRLRTLQEKKLALAKKSRREIADLLQKSRVETAKLRVEGLIQDDIYVELLELLELYSEMLQARFGLLDASIGEDPEPSIADAVCAIVYAAPRTELKELQVLREILMHKFGRNFSLTLLQTDPAPPCVPSRITSKLTVFTPAPELVDAYLAEIARGYGVPYLSPLAPLEPAEESQDVDAGKDDGSDGAGDGEGGGGPGVKEAIPVLAEHDSAALPKTDEKAGATSPVPPPASVLPTVPAAARMTGPTVVKKPTEDEELAARFERLKNLR